VKRFRLAEHDGSGVSCDERGLFVGGTALLERDDMGDGAGEWRPRPTADLNYELTRTYGLDVEASAKVGGFAAVARALARGDIAHAQLVALFLRMPDPPTLSKVSERPTGEELLGLAADLHACGLLKWDSAKHPRWPAGTPDGIGGEFSPAGAGASMGGQPSAHVAQGPIAIPFPGEIPEVVPRPLPFPEVVPPPIVVPNTMPRNPYPDRAGCSEEWAEAEQYCRNLANRGLLGKGDYRGHGKTFAECVLGQVSERCGGYQVRADA
jgi:hypothetical protein